MKKTYLKRNTAWLKSLKLAVIPEKPPPACTSRRTQTCCLMRAQTKHSFSPRHKHYNL